MFAEDVANKEAARRVIYSLFPGTDVYRVWVRSATLVTASDMQMAHLAETRARRVQVTAERRK